jgi:hypothetical protein
MPLPNADPDKRMYKLLKNIDLENLSFADFQTTAQTVFAEPEAEDTLRRIVLINLARMSVAGDWNGLTTSGGGGDVSKVGTPVNNEIGVWTGDGTIEGDSNFTFDGANTITLPGTTIFNAGSATGSYRFQQSGNERMWIVDSGVQLMGSGTAAAPYLKWTYPNSGTGFYIPATDILGMVTDGTERIRLGDSGEIGIAGANYGSDGQVLTSGGSGAAVAWEDAALSTTAHSTAPANAGATGTAGQIAYDADYIYLCIATDTWKRTAISTW